MPRKRRREIPTPAWERPHGAIGRTIAGRSAQFYAAVAVVLLVIAGLGVVGYGFAKDYIDDQNRPGSTAIRVGDQKFTLEYVANRIKKCVQQFGGLGSEAASSQCDFPTVQNELITQTILLQSGEAEGLTVSEDDMKQQIATEMGITADDPNFEARFQEELKQSGFTEDQYRDIVKAGILLTKMTEKLTAEIPASAESAHYRQILVDDPEVAEDIKKEIEDGGDFAQIAAEKSLHGPTKATGGDAGWFPRGILAQELEDTLFAMEPDEVIVYPQDENYWVYQLLAKEADRPIDESQKPKLASTALSEWINEKRATLEVKDYVSDDNEKARWLIDHAYSQT